MTSPSWYLNRFRMMPLQEIPVRGYRMIRDIVLPSGLGVGRDVALQGWEIPPEMANELKRLSPAAAEKLVAVADDNMAGRFNLFDKSHFTSDPIDWKVDPESGRRWSDADSHYAGAGDPKLVWELNRQQFLPNLGVAYLLTGEERYAQRVVDLIVSWVDANPPYAGINWKSGIEAALRTLSWAWGLRFIARSSSFDAVASKKIAESMYLQIRWVANNLSLYSSGNNHLISELMSMVVIGRVLGQEVWVAKGTRLLEAEIDRQIRMDGVGVEQSPTYQTHTMEYFALAALALREAGRSCPPAIISGLKRGARFIHAVIGEHGHLPSVGDEDSGVILVLSPSYPPEKTLLNLVAFLSADNRYLQPDMDHDDKLFWLIGKERFEKFVGRAPVSSRPRRRSRAFPAGGYYVLEGFLGGKRVRVLCDAGPLGMPPMCSHGHADALGITVDVDGIPVLVDPGTYVYFGSPAWRDYFRGTAAHNTVRLGGRNQAEIKGPFMSVDLAKAQCTGWVAGRRFSGSHEAYLRPLGLVHHRSVEFSDDGVSLLVTDRFEGAGNAEAELFFHLDSLLPAKATPEGAIEIAFHPYLLKMEFDKRLEVELCHGDEKTPCGWQSRRYGAKEPAFTLIGRGRVEEGSRFMTRIVF